MGNKNIFSCIKGYSFTFDVEDHHINAWFSAISGLEKVFVNGKLVASQRSFSKKSTNQFKIGENEYSTTLQIESLLKGPFVCTLNKNGKDVRRQRLVFPRSKGEKKKVQLIIQLVAIILLGVTFSIIKRKFNLVDEATYIFLIIVFLVVFIFQYKLNKNKNMKPLIEDEEIV